MWVRQPVLLVSCERKPIRIQIYTVSKIMSGFVWKGPEWATTAQKLPHGNSCRLFVKIKSSYLFLDPEKKASHES